MEGKDILNEFKIFLKINRSSSEKTIDNYLRDLKQFFSVIGITEKEINNFNVLQNIDNNYIKKWFFFQRNNNNTNRTISRHIVSIKMFFKFLNEIYNISNKFILNLNGMKFISGLPKAVSYKEILNIIENIDKTIKYKHKWLAVRDKFLIILLFSTGIRISECLNIKHLDIQNAKLNGSVLKIIGKGNKERIVPLIDVIFNSYDIYKKSLLNEKIDISSYLFLNQKGKKISAREVEKLFEILKINYNLQYFSPHVLRHSFATAMLENGSNIKQIQTLLGHENLATTQKYTKITKKLISDKLKKVNW